MHSHRAVERLELALVELEYACADIAHHQSLAPNSTARPADGALLVMLSAAEHALELCREALTREREADARARVGAERLD